MRPSALLLCVSDTQSGYSSFSFEVAEKFISYLLTFLTLGQCVNKISEAIAVITLRPNKLERGNGLQKKLKIIKTIFLLNCSLEARDRYF